MKNLIVISMTIMILSGCGPNADLVRTQQQELDKASVNADHAELAKFHKDATGHCTKDLTESEIMSDCIRGDVSELGECIKNMQKITGNKGTNTAKTERDSFGTSTLIRLDDNKKYPVAVS